MGHWGPGIFENDSVNDGVSDLCNDISNAIDSMLNEEYGGDPDEPDTDILIGYLKVLEIVYKNINELGADIRGPSKELVEDWRNKLFKAWDDFAEDDEPYWPERRVIVEKLFEDVFKISCDSD